MRASVGAQRRQRLPACNEEVLISSGEMTLPWRSSDLIYLSLLQKYIGRQPAITTATEEPSGQTIERNCSGGEADNGKGRRVSRAHVSVRVKVAS
jgi:hypothetical protein